jgi:F-type H+-transporting ATPase subunit a
MSVTSAKVSEETQNATATNELVVAEATEETNEVSHENTLFAEPIFHVGGFTITNSLLNSWLTVVILILAALALKKKLSSRPGLLQGGWEYILEGALKLADSVTGSRKKTIKIFPIVFALFLFILINNWLGMLPGVGSIGFIEGEVGHQVFVPLLRGGTADLNTTLALALVAVFGSNIFGIIVIGFWRHFNKFVNLRVLAKIPSEIKKSVTVILVNPIKFFVGIIEIIGEIAKVASLSFRLFGNVFAGEVLLSAMAVILAFGVPIPFMFLEVIVGIIQALIFAMLTLVYFTIASTAEEH